MTRGAGSRGCRAKVRIAVLCLGLGATFAAVPAGATLIRMPILEPPAGTEVSFDLGDPGIVNLDRPDGYMISLNAVTDPRFTNRAGDAVFVNGSIAFDPDAATGFQAGLLVFTSVRSGSQSVSTCPVQASRAPLAFRSDGFSIGGVGVDPLIVSDPMGPGTLCDAEGALFAALLFEGEPGTSQQFRLELELTRPLDVSEPHQLLNDAFALVPEVGTVPMLITGLAFFAAVCRTRRL